MLKENKNRNIGTIYSPLIAFLFAPFEINQESADACEREFSYKFRTAFAKTVWYVRVVPLLI